MIIIDIYKSITYINQVIKVSEGVASVVFAWYIRSWSTKSITFASLYHVVSLVHSL